MSQRILVVEDNRDSAAIIRSMLGSQHFEVEVVSSGVEALKRVKEAQFDLLLLDVMMPELSGLEVLKRLREDAATEHLPVILVTAKTQDDDVLGGYQYGADYYITKPFSRQQLVYGINLVLGKGESGG
jgi:DNA-binding response OmpR family regulator